ncbi:lysophospholipase L1-like esterase [Anoxybacillus tepidamans]|uniref:Lysophospholipase L1-like esterase n=1 Tax=Anoxybacteroides tepidamans TaxID=265948 RepID=A0A7W8IS68_9BACL|nr:SGNH/GDSL hydrolase family protein [Anoxybacillus tepidamans]MBB5325728.1 lysophospholipase L1-like esterase [Anoxybacillus tepidamans]
MKFNRNDRIVFIGDSITEWGRWEDPENIGSGYVRLIHDYFVVNDPNNYPEVINRGVGGDRITNLLERWEEDVIQLRPDFVSISIGINDVWRQLDHPELEQVYPEQFEQIYENLLTQVKEKTNAKLILMEPTIIEEDVHSAGNQKLVPYVKIVGEIANKFHAILVPTHQAFISYLQANSEKKLTTDGVHMNSLGNMLMAQTWIKAFEAAKV